MKKLKKKVKTTKSTQLKDIISSVYNFKLLIILQWKLKTVLKYLQQKDYFLKKKILMEILLICQAIITNSLLTKNKEFIPTD